MTGDIHREERALQEAFTTLDPTPSQVERMHDAMIARYQVERVSLAAEWVTLLRVRPVANTVYACAAAVLLLIHSPVGPLLWGLMR